MYNKMVKIEVAIESYNNVIAELQVPYYMHIEIGSILRAFQHQNEGKEVHGVCKETGEIFTVLEQKFTGNREWEWEEIREVCIKYRLFTCGSSRHYNRLYEMLVDGYRFDELMLVVWLCSDREDIQEVKDIFYKEFLPR